MRPIVATLGFTLLALTACGTVDETPGQPPAGVCPQARQALEAAPTLAGMTPSSAVFTFTSQMSALEADFTKNCQGADRVKAGFCDGIPYQYISIERDGTTHSFLYTKNRLTGMHSGTADASCASPIYGDATPCMPSAQIVTFCRQLPTRL